MSKNEVTFSNAQEQYRWSTAVMQESRHWTGLKRSKNLEKAISILQEIEISLRGLKSTEREINFRSRIVFGLLNYEIGMLYLKLMKLTEAECSFQKAWNVIKNHAAKPECIILTICLSFEISILYSKRNEPEKSFTKLEFARLQHQNYEHQSNPPPVAFDDLFLSKEQREVMKTSSLFKNHPISIYYILLEGKFESLVNYLHADLKDRLKSKGCNMLKWSMDCGILSKYFIKEENFKVARHILTSASQMIVSCEKPPKTSTSEKSDAYIQVKSYISFCWAMYALQLLVSSQRKPKEDSHLDVSESTKLTDSYGTYCLSEDSRVKEKENEFVCTLPSSFDEAKKVFVFGLEQVNLCENMYTANAYPSACMDLLRCKATLYGMLATFETDADRCFKMHERQISILKDVLKKFNSSNHLDYYRKLNKELATVCGNIASLKQNSYACNVKKMTFRNEEKINHYAYKGIQYHQSFINSFKAEENQMPEIFPTDSVKAILFSYYTMADLYLRITTYPATLIEYLQKSKEILQFIVKYVERNPSHEKYIKDKLEYIKESIMLIPNKIEEIQREDSLLEIIASLRL